jgi:hypothetical protein
MSVKKLFVRGELPKSPRRAFLERIRLRSFRPLAFDEEAEERHGWCALGRPLELEPPPEEVFQSDYLTLGLRWDRYRFPAALLNARLEQAARTLRGQSEGGKLSAKVRGELRRRVVLELRKKYLPGMKMVDMVWCLGRGEVFFWSHSASFVERLSALFELTFGLELLESSPWSAAVQLRPDAKSERALQGLEHVGFHGPR